MSAGNRSIHGVSARMPRQDLLARHSSVGSQVKPDSISTNFTLGNLRNTPSARRLMIWFSKAALCAT